MPDIVTFDGPNQLIIELDAAGDNEIQLTEIYSEWKEWVRGLYTFNTETDVNGTTERITRTNHSLHDGQRLVYTDEGGTETIGLTDNTAYFVRVIDADTIELYDTEANAEGGPATTGRQDLTASGVGLGESHLLTIDNSKFLQAFSPVGGDPISLTESLGLTYFLENGWRLRPAESSHKLTVVGNLFTREAGQSPFVATLGAFTVTAEIRVSNLTTQVTSTVDQVLLATAASESELLRKLFTNRAEITVNPDSTRTIELYDDDQLTIIETLTISATGLSRTT